MALILSDRVQETASAPGTGTVTLLGAVTGFQPFSTGVGNGNTCYYTIADQGGVNWEVGIGTYSSSGNTLARTTVLSSSAGGTTLVNFSSGTQTVFVTYPAEKSVNLDSSGNVSALGTVTSGTWQGSTVGIAYGGTNSTATPTAGAVIYGNGTSYAITSVGTTNQVLTSNGSSAPTWSTISANVPVYTLANASTLRTLTPVNNAQAIVTDLGLFVFVLGATAFDDGESAFAATGVSGAGYWLLQGASWQFVESWLMPFISRTEQVIGGFLFGSGLSNITAIGALTSTTFTIPVKGATIGSAVFVSPPPGFQTNGVISMYASVVAQNTVTVYLNNPYNGAIPVINGIFNVFITKGF
jgi:hypothetical protein